MFWSACEEGCRQVSWACEIVSQTPKALGYQAEILTKILPFFCTYMLLVVVAVAPLSPVWATTCHQSSHISCRIIRKPPLSVNSAAICCNPANCFYLHSHHHFLDSAVSVRRAAGTHFGLRTAQQMRPKNAEIYCRNTSAWETALFFLFFLTEAALREADWRRWRGGGGGAEWRWLKQEIEKQVVYQWSWLFDSGS